MSRKLPTALTAIASVLAFLAIFALWANRQLLDTDNWAETSSELIEQEPIREQVSIFLVDQLYANVDVEAQLSGALPPRLQPLAGPAAGALEGVAQRGVEGLLGRPRPQALWEQANRRAHARFLNVVEGGGDVVSTSDGEVTLDLRALLGQTADRVGVGGRAQQRIPEGAGELTIMRSSELELAQDAVRVLKALPVVLIVLMLALYALAVRLARGRRREALRGVGIGLVLAGVAALAARSLAGDEVVSALASTEAVRPAAESAWTVATSLLAQAAIAAIAYGAVILVAAWIAGPTVAATALRRELAPYLREPRYAYGVLGALVLALVAWGPTPATRQAIPLLLLIALLAWGVETLRRQTAREHPHASAGRSARELRAWSRGVGERLRGGGREASDVRDASDPIAALERLGRLRDAGVIDDAELDEQKRRILGPPPTDPPAAH